MIKHYQSGDIEIIQQEIPFELDDLLLITKTLKEHDVFTLFDREVCPYDLSLYIGEQTHGTQFIAYIGLNMLINILSVASDTHSRDQKFIQLGSAFILFSQQANILIEPTFALNESSERAEEELHLLRRIDSTNPEYLLKVLRGEWNKIYDQHLEKVPCPSLSSDSFPNRMKGYTGTKVALTRFASICRKSTPAVEKVKELVLWMHDDFIHEHTVTHLAFYQLAPNSKDPILKKVGSPKIQNIKKSIENAIGDLLLLRYWSKACLSQNTENNLYVLVTADESLLDLARLIFHTTSCDIELKRSFKKRLVDLWGERNGNDLSDFYHGIIDQQNAPNRASNKEAFNPFDSHYLLDVERELVDSVKN